MKKLFAALIALAFIVPATVSGQSITTLGADVITANTRLYSPIAIIPAITAHGTGNVVSNTALGNSVFNAATTGAGNVGIGSFALQNITVDQQNTAVGVDAFNGCAGSCAYGTAVGWGAGQTQLNGYGTFIGYLAGQGITTGTYNTIVGTSAFNTGSGITTGGGNTILGAQVTGLAAGTTNNIILANGTGAIKAQHDGTNWTLTGGLNVSTPSSGRSAQTIGGAFTLTVGAGALNSFENGTITAHANSDVMAIVENDVNNNTTFAVGAFTGIDASAWYFRGDGIAKTGAGTIATASTLQILNPPTIGTVNRSLWVGSGLSELDGHLQFGGAAPSIASGACGAAGNGSITGTDHSGKITIAGAATTACAVTFGTAFTTAPSACTFSPASAASAAVQAYVSALTVNGFTLSATALATTSWYYTCF